MRILLIVCAILLGSSALYSLANGMRMLDTEDIDLDCINADNHITTLEEERKYASNRLASGARNIIPAAPVVEVLQGRFHTKMAIAAPNYIKVLDTKILELKRGCDVY